MLAAFSIYVYLEGMKPEAKQAILSCTNADEFSVSEIIQELWSDYGSIQRLTLLNGDYPSVVLKEIIAPKKSQHPRGWNTQTSHERKLKSYEVEVNWYQNYSDLCSDECRVPLHLMSKKGNSSLILLEDLNSVGFSARKTTVSIGEINTCLNWLANFHANFINVNPVGLWEIGTYWHLGTRNDEFEVMSEGPIKEHAHKLDEVLNTCRFQTIVHGDAKLANFCFSKDGKQVAAVDFQYVGGGCGMKDVAYFLGSCLDERECHKYESSALNYYFESLKLALTKGKNELDFSVLEKEWRELYPIAWTDFTRFLLGWSPSHQKLNRYSKELAERAINWLT